MQEVGFYIIIQNLMERLMDHTTEKVNLNT